MPRLSKKPIYQQFSGSKICWDFTNLPKSLEEMFEAEAPLMVELGAGSCYFSSEFAKNHPDWNVLATDLKRDRLWKGAKRAARQNLKNIRFLNIDVANLLEVIGEGRADQLWLTFPDPFFKARQAKHRMNQPSFIQVYKNILKPGGSFHLKTDEPSFFIEAIDNLQTAGWQIEELSTDLHADFNEGQDKTIKTRYETEFIEIGLPINYLQAKNN